MDNIEEYLDRIGAKDSVARLEEISRMKLGARSDAAKRALEKRYRRKELINMGLTFENACLIVNQEFTK